MSKPSWKLVNDAQKGYFPSFILKKGRSLIHNAAAMQINYIIEKLTGS